MKIKFFTDGVGNLYKWNLTNETILIVEHSTILGSVELKITALTNINGAVTQNVSDTELEEIYQHEFDQSYQEYLFDVLTYVNPKIKEVHHD
jgi:hypothetical protein